jgi:hypothetical protein
VIPLLLVQYPLASFGFAGARSVESKKAEGYENNQRFRIYSQLISKKIGYKTFEHFEYSHVSSYLLVNKDCKNVLVSEREIVKNLCATYLDLHDL